MNGAYQPSESLFRRQRERLGIPMLSPIMLRRGKEGSECSGCEGAVLSRLMIVVCEEFKEPEFMRGVEVIVKGIEQCHYHSVRINSRVVFIVILIGQRLDSSIVCCGSLLCNNALNAEEGEHKRKNTIRRRRNKVCSCGSVEAPPRHATKTTFSFLEHNKTTQDDEGKA